MDSAKLNDWMQVIGIFALVASLIFVGLQMRQDRTLANVEAMSSRSDTIAQLAEIIGDNKELWIRALDGNELTKEEEAAFYAMNEAVESYFASLWRRMEAIGGEAPAESAAADYAYALYTHTGLRRAWAKQLEYWGARNAAFGTSTPGQQFRQLVDERLAKLDEDAPPIPDDKRYVFW